MTPILGYCEEIVQDCFKKLERVILHQDSSSKNKCQEPHSPPKDITWPLDIIANSLGMTRDYLDKLTQIKIVAGDKQKKFFKKLAKKHKQM